MATKQVSAERGWTYGANVQLVEEICCNCNMPFAMLKEFQERRLADHAWFYCPAGHEQHYTGKTAEQKAKDEAREQKERADRLAARLRTSQDSERFYRDQTAAARRSAAAYRGVATRIRNKVKAGICPVKGCSSSFPDIRQHMKHDHADWVVEHPEVIEP